MLTVDALQGDRVRLEPMTEASVDALLEPATRERSTFDLTTVPGDRAAMTAYVRTALAEHERGESVPFVVIDLLAGGAVGSTRFMDIQCWTWPEPVPAFETDRPAGAPSAVEIGHTWLARSVQRSRVNTEMKLLMLTHAFETWKVYRVTLKTDRRNERSRRAIERLGARFEGIRRAHVPAVDGTVRDTAYYSILREEWPHVRAGLTDALDRHAAPR